VLGAHVKGDDVGPPCGCTRDLDGVVYRLRTTGRREEDRHT